jgi:hypothetical protein
MTNPGSALNFGLFTVLTVVCAVLLVLYSRARQQGRADRSRQLLMAMGALLILMAAAFLLHLNLQGIL